MVGTNYYLRTKNKKLVEECFGLERVSWEDKDVVPAVLYIHLNKLSYGWRPLFQKSQVFQTFDELKRFYHEHPDDFEICDEYNEQYSWEDYAQMIFNHSQVQPRPFRWVYGKCAIFSEMSPILHMEVCSEEEAEIHSPFNHIEYTELEKEARKRFGLYSYMPCNIVYWNDPDYMYDWTDREFS